MNSDLFDIFNSPNTQFLSVSVAVNIFNIDLQLNIFLAAVCLQCLPSPTAASTTVHDDDSALHHRCQAFEAQNIFQ